jgi:hypothetical protein
VKASHPRELRRAKMLRELDLSWNQPWPQDASGPSHLASETASEKMTSRYSCVIY